MTPKKHYALGLKTEINLTPLIDVLLVLLVIILLVSTMFVRQLPVSLPVSTVDGVPVVTKSLQVSLAPSGVLMYGFSPISPDSLAKMVNPDVIIELSIDQSVRFETISETVGKLQAMRPKTIALVTR